MAGQVQVHGLSLESYDVSKKCDECGENKEARFNWLVVSCGCGCGEKRKTCNVCPAGLAPKCKNGVNKVTIFF